MFCDGLFSIDEEKKNTMIELDNNNNNQLSIVLSIFSLNSGCISIYYTNDLYILSILYHDDSMQTSKYPSTGKMFMYCLSTVLIKIFSSLYELNRG